MIQKAPTENTIKVHDPSEMLKGGSCWCLWQCGRENKTTFVFSKSKEVLLLVAQNKHTEDVSLMVSENIIYEITFFILDFSWQTNQNT